MAILTVVNKLKSTYQNRKNSYSGSEVEKLAAKYLTRHKLRVLEFNYRCRRGEIDLVMLDDDTLVFVEVRYRKNSSHGSALESVDQHKQTKLLTAAEHFIQQHHYNNMPCRFDVIAAHSDQLGDLHFDWVKDAFSY